MARYGVTDRDRGMRAITERVTVPGNHVVKVGVQGADAEQHVDAHLTMVGLATVHEFGATIQHPGGGGGAAGHHVVIPERSFIRATVDANGDEYRAIIRRLADQVLMGTLTAEKALGRLGLRIVSDIQGRIEAGIAPALAPATVRAKGSSKPLIDTGALKNAVTFVVDEGAT